MTHITPQQAQDAGFTIDHHTYPWTAYKGPRFRPTEFVSVLTDDEAEARRLIKNLLDDVRARYPGEELRCPHMRALDAFL